MNERRILGLDAGERRIGVAISDPGGRFALPLHSIQVDGREFEQLQRLVRDEDVAEAVIGLPLSLSGESSDQTERARAFAVQAESRLGLTVHLWDERLSSQEAERLMNPSPDAGKGRRRRGGRSTPAADTDAIAASIILQAYLDSLNFERS